MIRKIIVVIITLFISITSFAQINNTSVYSFFGIGDKNTAYTTEQAAMGGVGVSFSELHRINLSNPAANATLDFTNYTLGLVSKNSWAEQGGEKENASATYISYLAMGFNIGEKGGLSFGLLPNTSVGYNLLSRDYDDDGNIIETTSYQGEGGTTKVFLGFGYNVAKGLNLGIQGNYIFGKIKNNIVNRIDGTTSATVYETVANVNAFSLNAGLQYKAKVADYLNIYAGANLIFENEVKSHEKEYLYSLGLSARDTILNNSSDAFLKNPLKTTAGLGLGRDNKWYLGVDYSFQKALNLQGSVYNTPTVKYSDYSRIAIGGFYTPKYNSILSYWNRVTYRAGFHFENSGLTLDSERDGGDFEEVNNYGISFGIGLPVGKQVSNLNFGLELGKRGDTESNLVLENYVNFRLSISLNDTWFKKQIIY